MDITELINQNKYKNIYKERLIMANQTLPLDVSYEMNKNETGQRRRDMKGCFEIME